MSNPPQDLPPDENRGDNLVAFWWTTYVIVLVVVALRIYVRVIIKKAQGWDDWFLLLALVTVTISNVFGTLDALSGLGRHTIYLSPTELQGYLRWLNATQISAVPHSLFTKISVCIFVIRITPSPPRAFVLAVWLFASFFAAVSATTMIVVGLQCLPLRKLWDPAVPGKCLSVNAVKWVFQGFAICGVLTDFACAFIFPIFVLRSQQVDRATRHAIIFLLGLAIFPGVCCILKTYYAGCVVSPDSTWLAYDPGIWTSAETHFGMIIACLPILHPWIFRALRSMFDFFAPDKSTSTSRALYYIAATFSRWKAQNPPVYESRETDPPQTKTTTGTRSGKSQRESWYDISKLFHSPDTRNSESLPDTFRTIPPSPPPKLPPTPPPKTEDTPDLSRTASMGVTPRLSAEVPRSISRASEDLGRTSRQSDEGGQTSRQSRLEPHPAPQMQQRQDLPLSDPVKSAISPKPTPQISRKSTTQASSNATLQASERDTPRVLECVTPERVTPQVSESVTPQPSDLVTPVAGLSREHSRTRISTISGRVTPADEQPPRPTPIAKFSGEELPHRSQKPVRTSLMPHEDLAVFPTRSDPDFEERILRRMQALISPGPSRSQTPGG